MKEKLKVVLQQKSFFLLLFPCFFILHGYNLFFGFFPLSIILINLAGALLLTGVIYSVSYFIFFPNNKRSIFTFCLMLFIFLFRSLQDYLKKTDSISFFSKYSLLLPAFLIALFLIYLLLKRTTQTKKLLLFFNSLAFILLISESIVSVYKIFSFEEKDMLLETQHESNQIKANIKVADPLKPDIYFIVFDGMPNAQAMSEINSQYVPEFYKAIENRNFKIQNTSYSNYNQTVFSIASTLNMQYIDSHSAAYDHLQYLKALESLKKNRLIDFLQLQSYKIFQIQPLSFNNKDWNESPTFSNLLSEHFFYETLPGCMYKDLKFHLNRFAFFRTRNKNKQKQEIKQKNKELLLTLSKAKETSSYTEKPKFVYAHFMIPHEPYIYNREGKLLLSPEQSMVTQENELSKFYDQTLYAEKIALNLVDFLLKENKKNTVIVMEGDHGFRSIFVKSDSLVYKNLNTMYLPGHAYNNLYTSMSPVNTFRFVLNTYFDTRLPFLKDSSIFIRYSLPVEK